VVLALSKSKKTYGLIPSTSLTPAIDDRVVTPSHSEAFYRALVAKQFPSKYLALASGGHGLNGYQGSMRDA